MLYNVISVCSLKDLGTWAKVAQFLPQMIESRTYTLVVPSQDITAFKACTPTNFKILDEEVVVSSDLRSKLKSHLDRYNNVRFGWYLQQFIKIELLRQTPPNEVSLIWDADTVPLRPMYFQQSSGLLFFVGREVHQPYFNLIDKLLGIQKQTSASFISQCLPYKGLWAKEFCEFLENKYNLHWYEAIISEIDFSEDAGFSEYETLGNFAMFKHPTEMLLTHERWSRKGNSILGTIERLTHQRARLFSRRYAFMSFESWNMKRRFYLPDLFIYLLHPCKRILSK